jgi:DNA (cytosine-5)-methyltransferase 1
MSNFDYRWLKRDNYNVENITHHGCKVFSTFACGEGSTMGYKLAGYDVIGANDIDPQMAKVYKANHNPSIYYECPITDLLNMELDERLYDLDILDGSPPCSTFSMAGTREKTWKKMKKFREGQSEQILSDLFFEWIKLVDRLKPKIAIAENVKGMLAGNAKAYTKSIIDALNSIGYEVQLFLLNGASMGLPQRRERVFFICKRKDLNLPKLVLKFDDKPILFSTIEKLVVINDDEKKPLTDKYLEYWKRARPGESVGKFKTKRKIVKDKVLSTIDANHDGQFHYSEPRQLVTKEYALCGSFPLDYDYLDIFPKYLIGMSVPPVMMANVANEVYRQLLSKLN